MYENELPWTYIVTADHTMADPIVAAMWDIERDNNSDHFVPGRYRDGRPHAGVLSMETMWQRYPSMGQNANRHRANAISRVLLCDDYLSRPISFSRSSVDLLTQDPENAIRVTPACQSCHSTLDPLAATLFGFWRYEDGETLRELTMYRPELEWLWREYANRPPGYYGQPVANLQELGEEIADDQRFVDCAVKTMFEALTQRLTSDADWDELQVHAQTFRRNGLRLRPPHQIHRDGSALPRGKDR